MWAELSEARLAERPGQIPHQHMNNSTQPSLEKTELEALTSRRPPSPPPPPALAPDALSPLIRLLSDRGTERTPAATGPARFHLLDGSRRDRAPGRGPREGARSAAPQRAGHREGPRRRLPPPERGQGRGCLTFPFLFFLRQINN